ncbi:serine/threonine protein kinase [Streptomyces coelicoflavus]|uniref:non-specific serine/threonine protein kinase n=1 Tax=Streptomyces coelicoflavus TaxID=285562 RepID=A0A7K3PNH1_9ACTN|nr:serine/threonine-protein kinase [Streptomyces coelicoflavus]NEB11483.1 serine/threonine protein kinase [Streptomyces coelicoflavus]
MEHGLRGMLVGGRYRLDRVLAAGGFGRVWAARDEALQTDVAVKELLLEPHLSEAERLDRLHRAEREARNAAKLRDHPHIVSVHDVVVVDQTPWIVMQLVSGGTLQNRLAEDKRLSVTDTAKLAKALLHALRAAHEQGIIHRDVKPANVMLTDGDQILLTDFGIAISGADTRLTRTGLVIGSLPYLSPERAQGKESGPASDLFSLGTTLYEAVEGTSPFLRDDPLGSLHAVAYDEAPPMRRAGSLEPLISALMAKDPADRPSVQRALRLLQAPPAKEEAGKKAATGTASQATLKIDNQTGDWLSISFDGVYRDTAAPNAADAYTLNPGVRKVVVKSHGHNSAPCVLHLKAGTTERITARQHGRNVLLGSQQRPAEEPFTKSAVLSLAATTFGWIVAIAVTLTTLYAGNNSFADWVSSGLHGNVASAQVGDCVHETGEDEWVRVPCWSDATSYAVDYRVDSRYSWPRPSTGDSERFGCEGFYSYKADSGDVTHRLYRTVTFMGPDATQWELCVKAR